VSPRGRRLSLAALVAAADASLALAYQSPLPALALLALPAASLLVRPLAVHARLARILVWISRALLALAAFRADLGLPLGLALGVLSAVFLLDERSFSTGRVLLPAVVGIVIAAGANPLAAGYTPGAWLVFAVVVVWLGLSPSGALRPRRLVTLVVFVAIAAGLAHALIVFLPWAQPHVEETAARYMNPNVEAGLSIGARLGDIERLGLSRRVVLRMWSDEPMSLRAGVFARFDGRAWAPAPPTRPADFLTARPLPGPPPSWADSVPGEWQQPLSPPPPPLAFARFVASEHGAGVLPAPALTAAVKISERPVRFDEFRVLQAPPVPAGVYGIAYASGPAPLLPGDDGRPVYLETPAALDTRVRALAETLGGSAGSPAEKIGRTVADLQSRCRYSLEPGQWRTQDPVAEFLFDKKKGYCEYFASATVLLLRLQGVPARYVNGLSVREANRRRDHYVIRASDAHAWAEALVPGVGWVAVDSTPAGEYAQLHPPEDPNLLADLLDRIAGGWTELVARLRQGGWKEAVRIAGEAARRVLPVASPFLLALGLYSLARRWKRGGAKPVRARAPSRPTIAPELGACLARMEAVWMKNGHPRPRHRGPLEHALSIPPERTTPELRRLGVEVAECFYRGVYAGETIPPAELERLARAVHTAQATPART
jgi:transglutaminase-like putative cysteine protease